MRHVTASLSVTLTLNRASACCIQTPLTARAAFNAGELSTSSQTRAPEQVLYKLRQPYKSLKASLILL